MPNKYKPPFTVRAFALLLYLPIIAVAVWLTVKIPNVEGILRSPEYQSMVLKVTIITCICYCILYCFLFTSSSTTQRLRDKLMFFIGFIMFSLLTAEQGLPLIIYWFATEKQSIDSAVVEIDFEPGTRSPCTVGLKVEYDTSILSKICISKAFAQTLQPGQEVEIKGIRHP